MKHRILLIVIIFLFLNGCTTNKLKDHLKVLGFNCSRSSCEKSEEYNDIADDHYYSSGYTYSFDFEEKIFHIGYYKFEQANGVVSSSTGSYGYTYNWDTGGETVKNVTGNGTFQYNCNNNEIDILPLFRSKVDDNCRFLDQRGEYYQQFLVQCNSLPTICSEGRSKYSLYTNF